MTSLLFATVCFILVVCFAWGVPPYKAIRRVLKRTPGKAPTARLHQREPQPAEPASRTYADWRRHH